MWYHCALWGFESYLPQLHSHALVAQVLFGRQLPGRFQEDRIKSALARAIAETPFDRPLPPGLTAALAHVATIAARSEGST